MTASVQIPIWIFGKQSWISGVDRLTTVDDVMETLLGSANKQYTIIEKWRQVERPLHGDTRILKLWKTWGDAKTQVKLLVSRTKVPTKNNFRYGNATIINKRKKNINLCRGSSHTRNHPKHQMQFYQLSESISFEQLLKLIFLRRRTIQTEISRIKEHDFKFEQLKAKHNDSIEIGRVLSRPIERKLRDNDVTMEGVPNSKKKYGLVSENFKNNEITMNGDEIKIVELRGQINLLEKIVTVNRQLEKKEEQLVRLFTSIECCRKNDGKRNASAFALNQLKNENDKREKEIERNYKLLSTLEETLELKKRDVKELYQYLDESEDIRRNETTHGTSTNLTLPNEINKKDTTVSLVYLCTANSSHPSSLPNIVFHERKLNTLV